MNDELRDPELEAMVAAWTAPSPPGDCRARVMRRYDREFPRKRWFWPMVAVAVAAGLIAAFVAVPRGTRFEPVQQPRFIIISQGERP